MNAIVFGGTGMVGQGVLRECLLDPDVERVLSIVRAPSGQRHPKLRELVNANFLDFSQRESELSGFDAAFFCLGATSAGKTEEQYSRVTYDITMAIAEPLARLNPGMTFVFISGAGTDSTERGRVMWARVKGKAENALLRLPFKAAYIFRPGVIQPMHGLQSRTTLYRIPYLILRPLIPWLRQRFPQYVTTTEQLGRAMIARQARRAEARARKRGHQQTLTRSTFLLSIVLSIEYDIIRHPESPTTADHAVRQRFNNFLPDFLLPFGRLISVRSVVQLYPGP